MDSSRAGQVCAGECKPGGRDLDSEIIRSVGRESLHQCRSRRDCGGRKQAVGEGKRRQWVEGGGLDENRGQEGGGEYSKAPFE